MSHLAPLFAQLDKLNTLFIERSHPCEGFDEHANAAAIRAARFKLASVAADLPIPAPGVRSEPLLRAASLAESPARLSDAIDRGEFDRLIDDALASDVYAGGHEFDRQ